MLFKEYEARLLSGSEDGTYEIVKWDKYRKSCFTICFLKFNLKEDCYEIENVGLRPFEACAQTIGFAGWLQKLVTLLDYTYNCEHDNYFDE